MARYTPEFLAALRHGYENTDQPMRALAADFGIGITTLSTLSERHGWAKRSQRARGLPLTMQLLEEARALASQSAHSRDSGNPVLADHVKVERQEELGPRFRGDDGERIAAPQNATPTLPLSGGGSSDTAAGGSAPALAERAEYPVSPISRIERIVEQLIAAEEATPAHGLRAPQSARTLATLTQTLRLLRTMGGGDTETGPIDDDDMPRDLDEFRRDLARRIDAFVASRTDAADADGDSEVKPVDEAG